MNLWDRQAVDTDESWPFFQAYRDQNPPRRLEPVRCTPKGAVSPAVDKLRAWYRDHGWRDRVAAYDAHVDGIIQEEREDRLREDVRAMTARHLAILQDAGELVADQLAKYLRSARESDMHGLLKPNEIAKIMDLTVKLERLTRGESTERIEADVDLTSLSDEELAILAKIPQR